MTSATGPRLLLQYLEPSPAVDTADPVRLRDHLAGALERLPVTDVALGWRLRPEVIEAVRSVIPATITVWRWVPVFVDSGTARAVDELVAVGPDGAAPPPFRDMADFRFLCLDHEEVIEAGLDRAVRLGCEIDADGVLLDRIRWHSPSGSPAAEMTCFCPRSRELAAAAGLRLEDVAAELDLAAGTPRGRRELLMNLLSQGRSEPIEHFMAWRTATVTGAVERLASGLRTAGLASALDVFTPALTRSVGQDLAALAGQGQWSKSMTYFDAMGPASMPFELRGYAAWLEATGEDDAAGFLSRLLGFEAPGLVSAGARLGALRAEASRLAEAIGMHRAIVGIDAVEIPGVCEVEMADLIARVRTLRDEGLGLSPCWELLFISDRRLASLAEAWRKQGS